MMGIMQTTCLTILIADNERRLNLTA